MNNCHLRLLRPPVSVPTSMCSSTMNIHDHRPKLKLIIDISWKLPEKKVSISVSAPTHTTSFGSTKCCHVPEPTDCKPACVELGESPTEPLHEWILDKSFSPCEPAITVRSILPLYLPSPQTEKREVNSKRKNTIQTNKNPSLIPQTDRATAIEALRRSQYKFPGRQKIIVSKNWGFTPLRRDEYLEKRAAGKVKIDGAYVQFLRNKGPIERNMGLFPDAFETREGEGEGEVEAWEEFVGGYTQEEEWRRRAWWYRYERDT